ncbi:hypothetical protein D3C81_1622290 [compost metagenome]
MQRRRRIRLVRHQREHARHGLPGLEAILELHQQTLGGLFPDTRHLGQRRGVLCLDAAHQLIDLKARHQGQRQLRAHAIEADQLAEEVTFALADETIEQLGILAHHQMGVQGYRLSDRRQSIEGGHRHFQLIAQAVYIQNQVRRLLLSQGAA